MLRAFGQVAARGQMAHQIACRDRQGRFGSGGDLGIAFPVGLMGDLGVDIGGRAWHGARAHRFAARGFHGVIDFPCQGPRGRIFGGGRLVVVFALQRKGIGRATGQKHLVLGHPARDLRQAHALFVHGRGVDRIGHRHLRIIGHRARRIGERFFERIGGVVERFVHSGNLALRRAKGKMGQGARSRRLCFFRTF